MPAIMQRFRSAIAIALALTLAASACSIGVVAVRDQPLTAQPGMGLLAVITDTDLRLAVTFCRDASPTACTAIPEFTPDKPTALVLLPVGRYCLMRVVGEAAFNATAFVSEFEADDASCLDVHEGAINYPGHLVYRRELRADGRYDLDSGWHRRPGIERTLRQLYAGLAAWSFRDVKVASR